ncbi:alpha/beta fold hydrolase [Algoriphagus halophilus]|uniref:Pimeloyl-ACP methyl ester carboxylesterase n=1 Tax=Algoriphagus halophilus TaxID=226505 RepID=A0A1N6DAF7_9BACT|nr:alpha/beta hydrolase [Algoriphagus halophilus]SIN67717.1 Pimeloyl-ACP methyl ester carboxylesterase [Algoriphagus halophilus]
MTNEINAILEEFNFQKSTLIPVNGIQLEVFEAGQKNAGKPIILCHGWPEHAFSWRYQIPTLVDAGYHVIIPNQRGYGNSSIPKEVTDYDIEHLAGDLVSLLDHYGYEDAIFVGHDWGAMVTWWLALLHPTRVKGIIALAVPYQVRGDRPWIEWMEEILGSDYYFVHFNRQPGVADKILDNNTTQFLRNLFRKNVPHNTPEPGMAMINLAKSKNPQGEPVMGEGELAIFSSSFKSTGFTGSINWYRNLDRNWHQLANKNPIINQPALMIYGDQDVIPKFEGLSAFVPQVEEVSLDCGHWIQQEKPADTNQTILAWLAKNG